MIIWDKEKTDRIFEMRQQGITYQEIAQEFGTNKANISAVITRMRQNGYEVIKANPWTPEEEEELLALRAEGRNNKEIAEILGKSHDSVKKKASSLVKAGSLERIHYVGGGAVRAEVDDAFKEEILNEVRTYISYESCPTLWSSRAIRVFGSWTKALEAAGISGNIGGKFNPDKTTKVYLLDFGDFYKIGITQQQIKSRFSGAPARTILDYVETDLDNAVYLEKELKKAIRPYQHIAGHPWFERNGKTECFKTNQPIRYLEDIFAP